MLVCACMFVCAHILLVYVYLHRFMSALLHVNAVKVYVLLLEFII